MAGADSGSAAFVEFARRQTKSGELFRLIVASDDLGRMAWASGPAQYRHWMSQAVSENVAAVG